MWEHRLWGARELATNDGRRVRVIDPGRRNTDAGPDFFNAKVEIDGCLWAGNVEIHYRASDWHRHGHDDDPAYDTVVLHVVAKDDAPVVRANGERIPQMVMECTAEIGDRYAALVNSTVELPCRQVIREMTSLDVAEWVQSLIFERLADKSRRVKRLAGPFPRQLGRHLLRHARTHHRIRHQQRCSELLAKSASAQPAAQARRLFAAA